MGPIFAEKKEKNNFGQNFSWRFFLKFQPAGVLRKCLPLPADPYNKIQNTMTSNLSSSLIEAEVWTRSVNQKNMLYF